VEFDRLDKIGDLPRLVVEIVADDPAPAPVVGGPARKGSGPFDEGTRVTPKPKPLTHLYQSNVFRHVANKLHDNEDFGFWKRMR